MSQSWDLLSGNKYDHGRDEGGCGLGRKEHYKNCVVAEYVWLDAAGVERSKTKTLSKKPVCVDDLPIWNFDGSSTGQAAGEDSDIFLVPRALFDDPFRKHGHVLVVAECFNNKMEPAIGNYRSKCAALMEKVTESHDPWFGIEQEYTLMTNDNIGETSSTPRGFNKDGTAPAPQGPYYCGAGAGVSIGREVAEEHYAKCLYAGIKVSGINAEVMPGQWEYQVGPCRGIEMGDHLVISRYLLRRVGEENDVQVSFHPKPQSGDWNGAGCHTNFSTTHTRAEGGIDAIIAICEAFGRYTTEHIAAYGDDNEKRLTGAHETCDINTFKYGVAHRGCSIRIPRETYAEKRGYLEDRRPSANCDPYRVTFRMTLSAVEAIPSAIFDKKHKVKGNLLV